MTRIASPRPGTRTESRRARVLLLAVTILVAACAATPPPVPPSPALMPTAPAGVVVPGASPTSAASPAGDPTAAPSAGPSLAPRDAFVALVGDPGFSATATLTGRRTLGRTATTLAGTIELAGDRWHLRHTATTGRSRAASETIGVGPDRYAKAGAEWFTGGDAAGTGIVAAIRGGAGPVLAAGPATVDGRRLNRLAVEAPDAVATAFGLARSGVSAVATTVDVWVTDDGTPVHARLGATWTQAVSKGREKGSATLDLALGGVGAAVAIAAPESTWSWFASRRYRYRIAHPSDWEAVPGASGFLDAIYSPDDAVVYANTFASHGLGLDRVVRELRADPSGLTGFGRAKVLGSAPARLGALKARRVTITGTYQSKRHWGIVYLAVKGARVYWVEYRTTAAPTDADLAMAARIAATHRPR